MAEEEIHGFDAATADALLALLGNQAAQQLPAMQVPGSTDLDDRPGVWVRNTANEAAPPFACLAVVTRNATASTDMADAGGIVLDIEKPSATYRELHLFNGMNEIPAGELGYVYLDQLTVLHDPGWTLATGDLGGPRSGYWTIHKDYSPIVAIRGTAIADSYIAAVTRIARNRIFPVTLGSSVTDGGTAASVSLPDGRTVSAVNKSGMTLTAGNATVYQSLHDGAWYLTGARSSGGGGGGGSPDVWHVTSDQDFGPTDTATGLSVPGTAGVDVTNWGYTAIETGDRILVWLDADDGQYYALRGPTVPRMFKATLGGSLSSSTGTISVSTTGALDGGSHPGSVTANNTYHLSGANTAPCLITEDYSSGSLAYLLVQVYHVVKTIVQDVDWSSPNLRKITQDITVMHQADPAAPSNVLTFTQVTYVEDVYDDTTALKQYVNTCYVVSAGTHSSESIITIDEC